MKNQTMAKTPESIDDSDINQEDQQAVASGEEGVLSGDSLDMVRNILFGQQVRESKESVASLEAFVKSSLDQMQETMRQHVDSLQASILHQNNETRTLLAQETTNIKDNMSKQREELLAQIRQAQAKLEHEKVDRQMLSLLLGHVSKELEDN